MFLKAYNSTSAKLFLLLALSIIPLAECMADVRSYPNKQVHLDGNTDISDDRNFYEELCEEALESVEFWEDAVKFHDQSRKINLELYSMCVKDKGFVDTECRALQHAWLQSLYAYENALKQLEEAKAYAEEICQKAEDEEDDDSDDDWLSPSYSSSSSGM